MPVDLLGGYLQKNVYKATMAGDLQTVPARAGTATFVPAGSIIKIVNTSGTQAVDTWAFALPSPPKKEEAKEDKELPNGKGKQEEKQPEKTEEVKEQPKPTPRKGKGKKGDINLPSQEEAEQATAQGTDASKDTANPAQKKGWSSYLPSISLRSAKTDNEQAAKQKENSKTWSQYFNVGDSFTGYLPSKKNISSFASSHYRDPNKPLIEQITDFSRTPVGAAGMSALSGSGYASSLYAGYSAWSAGGQEAPIMEYLSMPHSRAATGRLVPRQGDALVSNLREHLLTIVEDTSGGVHDTLLAASDPQLYRSLGVEKWEEHGSSAENLVLALKELNGRAGLKGAKGIGAEITVNSVPAPFNLFRSVSWDNEGKLTVDSSSNKSKKGGHIRLRAERDVVIVLSAGPSLDGKDKTPQDAHFVVEEETDDGEDVRKRLESASASARPAPSKRASNAPRKLNTGASRAASRPTAARPAASSGSHTPIGTVKKPKGQAQSNTQNGESSTSASAAATGAASSTDNSNSNQSASAATSTPQPSQTPQSPAASQRKSSTSTVPSNTKHAGTTSTIAGSSAPSTAGTAAERRKPRKIQRRTPGNGS